MWQLDNRSPFAAAQGWIRNREGAEVWLVVVKASFDIGHDGSTAVAAEQPAPLHLAEHHGEPGRSSLRLDSDFVLTKRTTDILLIGHAHAPAHREVREIDVGLAVGPVQKWLRVFGDRRWGRTGLSDPEPFTKMALVYERAFGGADLRSLTPEQDWDWRNPVGRGYAVSSAHLLGTFAPNVELLDRLIRGSDDRPAPAGFGPIASHWQPRAAWAGTYGAKWEASRQPLLPDDCDDRFFQSAPADQQAPQFLVGGERVSLVNLNPQGRLDFVLPTMTLELESRFGDGERRLHPAPQLHSVILEPDLPRVSLVWHSALECHAKVHKLDTTLIRYRLPELDDPDDEPVDSLLDLV